jgi:hypothetical protein
VNALLHAEHDEDAIEVELRDAEAAFFNPGLPRAQAVGESVARNGRLLRMFKLAGLARGRGRGLEIIRAFDKGFRLQWNMLELSTFAELPLQFQEPDVPLGMPVVQVPRKKTPFLVSLPLAPIERAIPAGLILAELPSGQLPPYDILAVPEESEKPEDPEPEDLNLTEFFDAPEVPGAEETQKEEIEEMEEMEEINETEETDKYTDSPRDESKFSPLVLAVRDARPSPSVVREAILELCGEYRSISALASMLGRSEGSLRRYYVTAMVREGLLEMEFPDRVGHPEQRYKTRNVR